jgi:exopolysaccharide biosynthesis polyprenyl glycosylphosphotransferase
MKPPAVVHLPANGQEVATTVGQQEALVADERPLFGTRVYTRSNRVTKTECAPSEVLDRKTWQRKYTAVLRVTDTVVVCGALILAQYVRFGLAPLPVGLASFYATAYSATFAILWLSALAVSHTRSPKVVNIGIEEYRRVVAASLWTFAAIAMVTLILKLEAARGYLAVAFPAGILALVFSRWLGRRHVVRKRAEGRYQTAVLAIGERDAVASLAKELTRNPRDGFQIVGVGITGYGPPQAEHLIVKDLRIPILGGASQALEAIRSCGVDTVAIAGTEYFGVQGIRKLIWQLESMDVDLLVSPGIMDVASSRLVMRPTAGIPLLQIEKPQYHGAKRFQKRAFDFCFALAALIVTAPILVMAAIAIKASSRGPVFYSSERIGIDGRRFSMLKLRTMVEGADQQLESLLDNNESDGLLFKIRNDPRVTSVGRLLRRFSIDEMPQFLNVLRQEMSVVGPRPPLPREVEGYDGDVRRRLLVKPGMTGLWQVSGRSDLSWDEAVRLDLSYVDNWSMIGDIVIIANTLRAVLQQKGAY